MRQAAIVACVLALVFCVAPARAAGPPRLVDRALRHAARVYRVSYWQMRTVSFCESRWNPRAVGAGSLGLFQFEYGTWRGTPYRRYSVFSAWWNALAAAFVVRRDGGWAEWTCRP